MRALLFLIASSCFAQVTLTVVETTQDSVRVRIQSVGAGYLQVFAGLTSVPGATADNIVASYARSSPSVTTATDAVVVLGGLTPSTTYYIRGASRASANSYTGATLSAEASITTSAAPAGIMPQTGTYWRPSPPDTTGYTVIAMERGPSGECRAVSGGTSLQAVLTAAAYGTIIEIPQGVICDVLATTNSNAGYYDLPVKAVQAGRTDINDPTHQWIIIRTAESPALLPPPGIRADPRYAGVMAKFLAKTPQSNLASPQVFRANNAQIHHYWIQNIQFDVEPLTAADAASPNIWNTYVSIEGSFSTTVDTTPAYTVLDRILISPVASEREAHRICLESGGRYSAVINSHIEGCDIWIAGVTPTSAGFSGFGTSSVTIPQGCWALDGRTTPVCMAGTATLTGTVAGTATIQAALSPAGALAFYTSGTGSFSCTGCTVTVGTAPSTSLKWFRASTSGTTAIAFVDLDTYYLQGISLIAKSNVSGPLTWSNNRVSSAGLQTYVEAICFAPYTEPACSIAPQNILFERNWISVPLSRQVNNAGWGGRGWGFRNSIEAKRGAKLLVFGNLIEGNYSQQNAGETIFISPRAGGSPVTTGLGIFDVTIESNLIRNSAAGLTCWGVEWGAVQNSPTRRVWINNNIMRGLSRDIYNAQGAGVWSGHLSFRTGGCSDVTITNNSFGEAGGLAPGWLFGGGTTQAGKLNLNTNIIGAGRNNYAGFTVSDGTNDFNPTAFQAAPAIVTTNDTTRITSAFSLPGVTGNLMIGARVGELVPRAQMTAAEVAALAAQFPSGQIWAPGETITDRLASWSVDPINYTIPSTSASYFRAASGGNYGADLNRVEAALGVVQNIRAYAGSTVITLAYRAPDSKPCYGEVGTTRAVDAGGARDRLLRITGLSPGVLHTWNLHCYALQSNATGFRLMEDWAADRITTGSITTLSGSAISSVTIQLVGSATVEIMNPVTSEITQTACASTCSVAIDRALGAWRWRIVRSGLTGSWSIL